MGSSTSRGTVFRRCACRSDDGRQLGKTCPRLASSTRHGSWAYRVPKPGGGPRAEIRKFGFATKGEALAALDELLDRRRQGVTIGSAKTVGEYLTEWLAGRRTLKPSTRALYERYITGDITPALGEIRLSDLASEHVEVFVTDLIDSGRGRVTIRRIFTVLSAALNRAVKLRKIPYNPAAGIELETPKAAEREIWTITQAVEFLHYATEQKSRDTELYEFLVFTAMRRGEALALRWSDLDLDSDKPVARVERTLSVVPGTGPGRGLTFGPPKTAGSKNGVPLSAPVIAALERQRARQAAERREWDEAYEDNDLIFARENGAPQRPEQALRRFQALTRDAGLPVVRLHDLRHLAVSTLINAGTPTPVASKIARHATSKVTSDLYHHLTRDVASDAVGVLADVFAAARAEAEAMRKARAVLAPTHT